MTFSEGTANAGSSSAASPAAASPAVVSRPGNQSVPIYTIMDTGAGGMPTLTCVPDSMMSNFVGLSGGVTVSSADFAQFALNLLSNAATSGGDRPFLIGQDVTMAADSSMADALSGQSGELNQQIFMQYLSDGSAHISTDSFTIPSLSELSATGSMGEQVSNDLNVGAQELVLEEGERGGADGKRHPLHIE